MRMRPAGAGAVAPSPAALCSATGPVHARHEHRIYPATLLVAPFPVLGVEKKVGPPSSLPDPKKGRRKPDVGHGVQVRCRAERAYGGVRDISHESGDANCVRASTSTGQANGRVESGKCASQDGNRITKFNEFGEMDIRRCREARQDGWASRSEAEIIMLDPSLSSSSSRRAFSWPGVLYHVPELRREVRFDVRLP